MLRSCRLKIHLQNMMNAVVVAIETVSHRLPQHHGKLALARISFPTPLLRMLLVKGEALAASQPTTRTGLPRLHRGLTIGTLNHSTRHLLHAGILDLEPISFGRSSSISI